MPLPIIRTRLGLHSLRIDASRDGIKDSRRRRHRSHHSTLSQGDATHIQHTLLRDQLLLDRVSNLTVHTKNHERFICFLLGRVFRRSTLEPELLRAGGHAGERRGRHAHEVDVDALPAQDTAHDADLAGRVVVVADQERALGHKRRGELAQPRDDRRVVAAVARDDVLSFAGGGGVVCQGRGHGGDGLGAMSAEGRGAAGWARDQRHHAAVRLRHGVARFLLVDEQPTLARDHLRVDDVHVEAAFGFRDRGHQPFDQCGEERFRARHLCDFSLVDEVEGIEVSLGWLCGRGEVLRVQGPHLLDELDERLERLVLCGQDDGSVDGAAGQVTGENLQDLFAHVDRHVFLGFDGGGAQVRRRDAFWVLD